MKQYLKTKKSVQKGMLKIPSAWKEIPLKYLAAYESNSFTDGPFGSNLKASEYTESGVMLIQLQNIGDGEFYLKNTIFISEEKFASLRKHNAIPGDIVVSKMADPIARACLVPTFESKYFIISDCIRLRTQAPIVNNTFLVYGINSPYFRQKAISFGGGSTRQRIQIAQLKKLFIILPNLETQNQIVHYLKHKIEKINNEISKNKKLIQLIKEKRESLIHDAVTKGIDKKATLMDSRIKWYDKVPKHWNFTKMSWAFKEIGSGTTPKKEKGYYSDDGIPCVNSGDLNDGEINSTKFFVNELALKDHSALKLFSKNTVIIAMYGASIGNLGILNYNAVTNQSCCNLSKSDNIFYKFIFYWFFTNRKTIISFAEGGGQPNINQKLIKSMKLYVPSLLEQKNITDYIDKQSQKINLLISKIESQIQKLQEFKKSIISSAVTGEIQV